MRATSYAVSGIRYDPLRDGLELGKYRVRQGPVLCLPVQLNSSQNQGVRECAVLVKLRQLPSSQASGCVKLASTILPAGSQQSRANLRFTEQTDYNAGHSKAGAEMVRNLPPQRSVWLKLYGVVLNAGPMLW